LIIEGIVPEIQVGIKKVRDEKKQGLGKDHCSNQTRANIEGRRKGKKGLEVMGFASRRFGNSAEK